MNKTLTKWMRFTIEILFFIFLVYVYEYKGLAMVGVYYLVYSIYMVWRSRSQVIAIKHYIETMIWGKPLKMFTKNELKNTKIVFVWNKKGKRLNMKTKTLEQLESDATQSKMYYNGFFLLSAMTLLIYFLSGNFMVFVGLYICSTITVITFVDMQFNVLRHELRLMRK